MSDEFQINRTDGLPTIRDAAGNRVAVKVESSEMHPAQAKLLGEMLYGEVWVAREDGKISEVFWPVEGRDDPDATTMTTEEIAESFGVPVELMALRESDRRYHEKRRGIFAEQVIGPNIEGLDDG